MYTYKVFYPRNQLPTSAWKKVNLQGVSQRLQWFCVTYIYIFSIYTSNKCNKCLKVFFNQKESFCWLSMAMKSTYRCFTIVALILCDIHISFLKMHNQYMLVWCIDLINSFFGLWRTKNLYIGCSKCQIKLKNGICDPKNPYFDI